MSPSTMPAPAVQPPGPAEAANLPAAGGAALPGHPLEPLEGALAVHNGAISHTARQLRVSRGALYRRLKSWRQNAPE